MMNWQNMISAKRQAESWGVVHHWQPLLFPLLLPQPLKPVQPQRRKEQQEDVNFAASFS
jgi:hypothetical protein